MAVQTSNYIRSGGTAKSFLQISSTSRRCDDMNGILDAAVEVDRICREQRLPYCIIGGIALQGWGEPRTTLDVDITVYTGFGKEKPVIERLLTVFQSRVPDAAEFALQSRVVLAQTELGVGVGVGVDVSLGAHN